MHSTYLSSKIVCLSFISLQQKLGKVWTPCQNSSTPTTKGYVFRFFLFKMGAQHLVKCALPYGFQRFLHRHYGICLRELFLNSQARNRKIWNTIETWLTFSKGTYIWRGICLNMYHISFNSLLNWTSRIHWMWSVYLRFEKWNHSCQKILLKSSRAWKKVPFISSQNVHRGNQTFKSKVSIQNRK